jgi:hypothetical protein
MIETNVTETNECEARARRASAAARLLFVTLMALLLAAGSFPSYGAVAPVVTAHPQDATVAAGGTATFTASATGDPAPDVKWQFFTGTIWTDIVNATSATLSVTNANAAFSGRKYRAAFTNGEGSATTGEATLTVTGEEPPGPGGVDGPAVTVTPASVEIGGKLRVAGAGFSHPTDTEAGSVVAIKIDDGAYSHTEEGKAHDNLSVWSVVYAGADGSFDVEIALPDGTTSGANGSTPAFTEGSHTLRFLTGSLKAGDIVRTVKSGAFIVGSYRPTGDPDVISPDEDLPSERENLIAVTFSGSQSVIAVYGAEPGGWVHLSAYLGQSVRYPWGKAGNFVVDENWQVSAPLASGAFDEAGTYRIVARDVGMGKQGETLGWMTYTVSASGKPAKENEGNSASGNPPDEAEGNAASGNPPDEEEEKTFGETKADASPFATADTAAQGGSGAAPVAAADIAAQGGSEVIPVVATDIAAQGGSGSAGKTKKSASVGSGGAGRAKKSASGGSGSSSTGSVTARSAATSTAALATSAAVTTPAAVTTVASSYDSAVADEPPVDAPEDSSLREEILGDRAAPLASGALSADEIMRRNNILFIAAGAVILIAAMASRLLMISRMKAAWRMRD